MIRALKTPFKNTALAVLCKCPGSVCLCIFGSVKRSDMTLMGHSRPNFKLPVFDLFLNS